MTLIFRLGNIVPGRCRDVDHQELSRLFREETGIVASRGRIQLPGPDATELTLNATHVAGLSALDAESLTQAERMAHRQARAVWEFYREHVPGCEGCVLAETAPHIGIRESRRILGDYVLTREDVLYGKKFEDSIGCSTGWVDIHNPSGEGVLHEFVRADDWYEIPYRSLTARGFDNLLVAGRSISATHEAISAVRVIPTCVVTGQGAGVAAALVARKRVPVRQVPLSALQAELRSQNVFFGHRSGGE
jgi:hypothetical protein